MRLIAKIVVDQKEARSWHGVKIPYFIVYTKGTKFDGTNPTLLEAYSRFQVINSPYFSRMENEVWVKHDGVSVLTNIRGGGEFGPESHYATQGIKRQTGMNDFIPVAEDLIKQNINSVFEKLNVQHRILLNQLGFHRYLKL